MARKVFFSFHYDDVINFRANVVRKHGFFKGNQEAGFWDNSIWEEAKKTGETALKRLINGALEGTSVTCVLIGTGTYNRPWVRYEIFKSIERGNGILGIHINGIKGSDQLTKPQGSNPFVFLSLLKTQMQSNQLTTQEWNNTKWVSFNLLPSINYSGLISGQLHNYFQVYDWAQNDGYNNFADWVEYAATNASR